MHPRLRGNNLVTTYGFLEGCFVILKKASYMDDKTWANVVKVVSPGIRKMAVINLAFFLYSIRYLSNYTSMFLLIICR